jgi:aryl-alcohol dehydrogenase-like predicted oxidoreductase
LRIGLGCMRMSTDHRRDQELAGQAIAAAAASGMTVFDTARAYGRGEADLGRNERLLAGALRRCGAERRARMVTKGGMTRINGGWVPDGRAKAILSDCEASLVALDGLPIDVFLIHAPDPRTPWRTSVRALARLVDEGLVRRVGLSNVSRQQLNEALELAPVTAVEVALSFYDDRAVRGGIVERCAEKGIAVIAHSPLGGPRRAGGLATSQPLTKVAAARSATAAEVALAWLLALSPTVVAIPAVPTRCIWLDTPLAQAQVNLVERLLDRFGALPTPDELRKLARHEPGVLVPTSQMRALRELEPPSADEGFGRVERIAFARTRPSGEARAGVFVAAAALHRPGWERALEPGDRDAPHLIFDWNPDRTPDVLGPSVARLRAEVSGRVESALCPHAAGPPRCWCRPPLPGLPLAFARTHNVDPVRSVLIGASAAHRTLAATLGAEYVPVAD